jgi:hypothetical protein
MRIDVSAGIPQRLNALVERFGSTNVSVLSRVVDWLVGQDDEVKATILRIMPATKNIDVQRRLLEAMVASYRNS